MNLRLIIIAAFCFTVNLSSAQNKRPNILIILVDDMGWRDVGFMGSQFYETPVIDSLVARGMVFEVRITDPVDVLLIAGYAEVEEET